MTAFEERHVPEQLSASSEACAPARVTLSMHVATRLLDLLASDDAYRARFEANPRAALLEVGHETPAAHLGVFGLDPVMNFSHFEGGLASKAVLAATRNHLLSSGAEIFAPFDMCSNC